MTPLETEIMNVLWDHGTLSVAEVQQRLGHRKLAYTTIQTMLNILVRKGHARRTLVKRSYRYRAATSRRKAAGDTLRNLVRRMFGGSAEALVLNLIDSKQLTPETLRRLQKLAAKAKEKEK